MAAFLALLFGPGYWKVHSVVIALVLRMKGVRVGRGFYTEGIPKLKIRGKAQNIVFGNRVSILGDIDLRNRENGRIVFHDDVTIERDCRFVSAREGTMLRTEPSLLRSPSSTAARTFSSAGK